MLPRPPISTLFPYTTLFRSSWLPGPAPLGGLRDVEASLGDGEEDRKSTRLNSSHRTISYAVFCLKKKNLKISKLLGLLYYTTPSRLDNYNHRENDITYEDYL